MIKRNLTFKIRNNLDYRHLRRMTDERGMLQFCHHADPDPDSGYTVDDNARALIVALNSREDDRIEYALRYTKFWLRHSVRAEIGAIGGSKRGFVTDIDSNDSLGRAFLASSWNFG